MPTVAKDILYPGDWHLPDGRVFRCSAADVGYFAKRMQDMVDDGLPIPGTWEHQDKVKPVTREQWQARNAETVKLTFGHASAAKVNPAGALEVVAELDDGDAQTLLKKIKFVSPQIEWDYKDPRGKVWPGPSILHFAATARPVQTGPRGTDPGQKPFALSSLVPDFGPVQLSLAAFEPVALSQDDPSKHAEQMSEYAANSSDVAERAHSKMHHQFAADAHMDAAKAHDKASTHHGGLGNTKAADEHHEKGNYHFHMSGEHQRKKESTPIMPIADMKKYEDSSRNFTPRTSLSGSKPSLPGEHAAPPAKNIVGATYPMSQDCPDCHAASDKANESSEAAYAADKKTVPAKRGTGVRSVGSGDYHAAAAAHKEAHGHHVAAQKAHEAAGNGDEAGYHARRAEGHREAYAMHHAKATGTPTNYDVELSQEAVSMALDDLPKKKKKKLEEPGDNGPDGGGVSDSTTTQQTDDADGGKDDSVAVEDDGDTKGAVGEDEVEGKSDGAADVDVEPIGKGDVAETPQDREDPSVSDGPHPMMQEAVQLAHKIGLHIGEDCNEKNFIDRFIVAAKTRLAAESPDDQDQDEVPTEQAPPVVSMSQNAGDPEVYDFHRNSAHYHRAAALLCRKPENVAAHEAKVDEHVAAATAVAGRAKQAGISLSQIAPQFAATEKATRSSDDANAAPTAAAHAKAAADNLDAAEKHNGVNSPTMASMHLGIAKSHLKQAHEHSKCMGGSCAPVALAQKHSGYEVQSHNGQNGYGPWKHTQHADVPGHIHDHIETHAIESDTDKGQVKIGGQHYNWRKKGVAFKPGEHHEPVDLTGKTSMSQEGIAMSQEKLSRLEQLEQDQVERRLSALVAKGVITKPIHDRELAAAKAISLSADTAPGRDSLLVKLSAWEELPAKSGFTEEDIGKTVAEVPLSAAGSMARRQGDAPDKAEADKEADEMAARATGDWDHARGQRRSLNGTGKH